MQARFLMSEDESIIYKEIKSQIWMQMMLWWISIIKETVNSFLVNIISWLKMQQTQWMTHESESRWESHRWKVWSLKKRFSLWCWMNHMIKHCNQSALSRH